MARSRALQRQVESVGKAPGSIVIPEGALKPRIDVTIYNRDRHEVRQDVSLKDLESLGGKHDKAWVDVTGLGDREVLEGLLRRFDLPWLVMEDVLHATGRPKAETYGDALFVMSRTFDRPGTCEYDQFSVFVRGNVAVTFQERPGDPFKSIRERLKHPESQLRQRGIDYLVYRLLDSCVDSMFPEIQRLADSVEAVEEDALERPGAAFLAELHKLRRELRILDRSALGMRDTLGELVRDEARHFAAETRPYLRDAHDHASQIVELCHYYTNVANDVAGLILSTLDLKMNQAMKILAGVTVIFMPLSLVAGIYGMNFDNMPETHWAWGYYAALAVIFVVGVALTIWMRRIGFLRSEPR